MTKEEAILHMTLRREILKHSVGDLDEDIKAFDMAIEALEQTRWIPVSERLPEDGKYLICADDGYIATIMYDRSMGWLLNPNIIAWMPLPQPYKAEVRMRNDRKDFD